MIEPKQLSELRWRYNLPFFTFDPDTITMAMFNDGKTPFYKGDKIIEIGQVKSMVPFSNESKLSHIFLRWNHYKVHVVIMHRIKHFFWVSQIPEKQLKHYRHFIEFNINFGVYEQIFDPFELSYNSSILIPANIEDFLSQISTSRYMHCPPERQQQWLQKHNLTYNQKREEVTIKSIMGIKSLMKELKMEFWAMCGTLLGWYRQCGIIPYTDDNDFSTWPKYLKGKDLTPLLLSRAPENGLYLLYRFGEARRSMEYSFRLGDYSDKVDMFFSYRNDTHFLLPSHLVSKHTFQYSIYPIYELCSIELLGYKLLAPCDPEKVILTEYGPDWMFPKIDYNLSLSPFNIEPMKPYISDIPQVTIY